MNTQDQLRQLFNDNFVAYFRSHVAHVNIMGRNFASDHELLKGIYEDLQDQIDVIAELLRTVNEFMPNELAGVVMDSNIQADIMQGSSDVMLESVLSDLTALKQCYEDLVVVCEDEHEVAIGNYAQDRILTIAKFVWMIKATLDLQ